MAIFQVNEVSQLPLIFLLRLLETVKTSMPFHVVFDNRTSSFSDVPPLVPPTSNVIQ